jgi:PAS domain-containing protein
MGETAPRPVELILARSLMSSLATPACLVDVAATLVFFNDAAAAMLGVRFEEAGPMNAEDWGTCLNPVADDGRAVAVGELPLLIALNQERPVHRRLWIRSAAGCKLCIEVSAVPIDGSGGVRGAMALFWECPSPAWPNTHVNP